MTTREQRAILVGFGIVAAGVLAFRVAPAAARRIQWLSEDLAAKQMVLERSQAMLAGRFRLSDSITRLTTAVPGALAHALSGHDIETGVRDFVARTTVIVTRHGTRLERVQPHRDSLSIGRLRRVSGRAVFETDTPGMAAVLADLARDSALAVDRVEIENMEDSEEHGHVDAAAPERLRITVEMHAWFIADSSGAALPRTRLGAQENRAGGTAR